MGKDMVWPGEVREREFMLDYLAPLLRRDGGGRLHYLFASPLDSQRSAESNCLMRFVWMLEGETATTGFFDGALERRVLKAGDVLICGHSGWNSWLSEPGVKGSFRGFSVIFHLHHIRLVYNEFVAGQAVTTYYFHTVHPVAGIGVSLLETLNGVIRDTAHVRESRARALLYVLLEQLLIDIREEDSAEAAPAPVVEKLLNYIHRNFQRPISCLTICDALRINRSYASTVFRRQTGKTLKEYLLQLRMNEAVSLLNNSDLSVDEIGRQCGYVNVSYFIRVFRQFYRMPPGELRQRHSKRAPEVSELYLSSPDLPSF